ncbi:hypothetical protein Tco_0040816 [Tanacetum coccineum]
MKSRWRLLFLHESHLDSIFSVEYMLFKLFSLDYGTFRTLGIFWLFGSHCLYVELVCSIKKTNTLPWFVHGMQCNTPDINYVPIRRVFDRFRNMRMLYIEADSMTHPDIEGSGDGRNVRSRLSAGHSSMLRNASVFSGAVELRPETADTIRGRGTTNINCFPVRRVFDRFRNMRSPYIEVECMTQPAICKRSLSTMAELYPTVCVANHQSSKAKMLSSASDCLIQRPILTDVPRTGISQSPVLTLNHVYFCLDIEGCNIKPTIIGFLNIAREDICDIHLSTERSHSHTQHVHTEAFAMNTTSNLNARKRKTAHPLSIPRAEEPSSSGNMIRRFIVRVNIRSLRSKSSHAQGDASSYIDLGNCDQIYMPSTPNLPTFIQQVLTNNHFIEHIRAYNQMFAMTSFGAKIDDSVKKEGGLMFLRFLVRSTTG